MKTLTYTIKRVKGWWFATGYVDGCSKKYTMEASSRDGAIYWLRFDAENDHGEVSMKYKP